MARQQSKDARRQVQRQAQEIVRRYNMALHVACRQAGADYQGIKTPDGCTDYSIHEPNALGRQIPGTGTAIHAGQAKASGKPLAPLPRYTP